MKREMLNIIGKEFGRIPKHYDLYLHDLLELHTIYDAESVTAFRAAYVFGFVMGSRAYKNGSYREKRGSGVPFEVKRKREEKKAEAFIEKAERKPYNPKKIKEPRYMVCVGENREPELIETWAYEDGSTAIYIETQDVGKVEMLMKKGKNLLKKKICIGVFDRCENGKLCAFSTDAPRT